MKKLAELDPLVVAPGHGKPLAGGDVAASLWELAAHFEQVAIPENSRRAA